MSEFNLVTANHAVKIEVVDFPDERAAVLERFVRALACMIPSWCHELIVWNCAGRETEAVAEASCQMPYHRANINIFDGFWQNTLGERGSFRTFKHEFTHVLTAPLFHAMVNALDCAFPNEADCGLGYKHMQVTLKESWEFITCDIERNWAIEFPEVRP